MTELLGFLMAAKPILGALLCLIGGALAIIGTVGVLRFPAKLNQERRGHSRTALAGAMGSKAAQAYVPALRGRGDAGQRRGLRRVGHAAQGPL